MATVNPYLAAGAGGIGAGLGAMMGGWNNPADAAMPLMNQIPAQLEKYLSPYINAGNAQLPGLQKEYGSLMTNPGQRLNQIGADFKASPGFQFQMQQALQGANHAAAAGGMAGSPQAMQQNMQVASDISSNEYNNYLRNALGLYGMGMQGSQGLYDTGARAGMAMGEDMSSVLANQAKLAYEGANAQNQHDQGIWGALGGGAGTIIGSFL